MCRKGNYLDRSGLNPMMEIIKLNRCGSNKNYLVETLPFRAKGQGTLFQRGEKNQILSIDWVWKSNWHMDRVHRGRCSSIGGSGGDRLSR